MAACLTCGAAWSEGRFSEACRECGGGAMDRACPICGGRCGARFLRAVSDSNDSAISHWAGRCKLPEAEQRALMEARRGNG